MADPLRDAAERLLQQLDLHAPLYLESAKSDLRAALAAQPPAAATDTPLDIDALLSPEGAYERVSHGGNGAQLVSGRHGERGEWWRPVVGMDTLENLLDRIRTRILPHLRPPIAGIDVPGGDGDYGGLQELCEAEGVDVRIGAPLLKRAREAWKVAAHPPAPAPASDGEREELADAMKREAGAAESYGHLCFMEPMDMERAATLLREPAPAPAAVAVAVAERPWQEEGWCDKNGMCWMGYIGKRRYMAWEYTWPESDENVSRDHYTVSLAHSSIPRPETAPVAYSADLTPTRYTIAGGVTIERTRTNPDAWAVRRGSERLSVSGGWSIEPMPSERTADYLAEHTFPSPQAALEVLQRAPQGGEVQ